MAKWFIRRQEVRSEPSFSNQLWLFDIRGVFRYRLILSLPLIVLVERAHSVWVRQGDLLTSVPPWRASLQALEYACPGKVAGLTLEYRRYSWSPLLLLRPSPNDSQPCGVIKLSCRLGRGQAQGAAASIVITDHIGGQHRTPAEDSVVGEVAFSHLMQTANTSLPRSTFGLGVVIPPNAPLFRNCNYKRCLKGVRDLPEPMCAWSGGLMGFLQRFHAKLGENVFNNVTYKKMVRDPQSLDSFALLWIMDALNQWPDRSSTNNLYFHREHYIPLDIQSLNLRGLRLDMTELLVRHPLFLRGGSGLSPTDVPALLHRTVSVALDLCGSRSGPCDPLQRTLERQLAGDQFLSELDRVPHGTLSRLLCRHGHGLQMVRRFDPCCPRLPERKRRLCAALQQHLPPSVASLGDSPAQVLARLLSLRLAAARDTLFEIAQNVTVPAWKDAMKRQWRDVVDAWRGLWNRW